MFREDHPNINHQETEKKQPPGSIAEKVEYQTKQDSEKMRRWRGWRAMMDEGDSTFGEMFGYTRFQKALAKLALEYNLEEYYPYYPLLFNIKIKLGQNDFPFQIGIY